MEIRDGSIHFEGLSGDGPREASSEIHFPREIRNGIAGLSGYNVKFKDSDHHLGQLIIRLSTEIDGDLVKVKAHYGLRDWSGNWDDKYEGTIFFVVLAELEAAGAPRPRADLSITGIEITQAIQHFRSSQHLDPDNVRPNNSIPLIARKDTGLRLYMDYDAEAGLPAISQISGVVEVNSGSASFTLAPVATIVPRDDSQIDRGVAEHTLNFVIPEAWCRGEVNIACKIFDALNPALPSRTVRRTLSFDARSPLRMHAVGVHYTGKDEDGNDQDLPAPTLDEIIPNLEFVELTYPVPEVFITGYTEIETDRSFIADIDDGCGDGFGNLLGTLRDLRGDSSDVYYGFLPEDIDIGEVGGCGGGGVAASRPSRQQTMAQEIAHALGRDHAPCDSEDRCGNPSNPDAVYPQYAEFPSDSIGEFGYDPHTDSVFDPADSFDFMGYSKPKQNKWVSPYTYMALMGAFPPDSGLSSAAFSGTPLRHKDAAKDEEDSEWVRSKRMMLDLEVAIERNRTVARRTSFHYPVVRTRPHGKRSDFTVDLLDKDGQTLTCQPLIYDCHHCNCDNCYPLRFRQWVPFNAAARKLVIREGDVAIHEEPIPDPPTVRTEAEFVKEGNHFVLQWKADEAGSAEDLWYLVHWQDEDGSWKGVAPRTRKNQMVIPVRLFGRRKEIKVRVLASSGIATAIIGLKLTLKKPNKLDIGIVISKDSRRKYLNQVIRATVIENNFRTIPGCDIRWYDDKQQEIGRGRSFSLRRLRRGDNFIKAVLLDRGYGSREKDWIVERTENGEFTIKGEMRDSKPHIDVDRSMPTKEKQ